MHELSIAEAIAEIAAEHARGARVRAVHVRAGHLRQIVPDALAFSFELVTHGTPLEGARLELEQIPIAVVCRTCGDDKEHALDGFPIACPACGSVEVDVVRGEELRVDALELDHELTRSG